ncbi:MAG: NADH:flavin oxidoreductase [Desulfobacterales bacterium]|jgi:2,4-dienoyl-CoA reductase-like NADH-dependent reductase (Old Yellow Enzyme family)|nr:NADH:flavin oxidoreductase [Desulfobacterales bacterium]MDH3876321.1 NADH:flavin oxidoreductase [Desulfobacterales bacterium]
MPKLFAHTQLKDLKLANRFIRSATWEGLADENGGCTFELVDRMVELARGRVGLIITGHTYVHPAGQATPYQLGVDKDERIDGLSEMTEAVHREGGRIMMQLAHSGLKAEPQLTSTRPIGPSTAEGLLDSPGKEMTTDDIQQVVASFSQAAQRAKAAGFDGVQIHAAHGYLLSQFLSPAINQRTDEYGGSVENRARIVLEVLRNIRQVVGRNFPILIKINSEDFLENGLSLTDFLQVAVMLGETGIDAIEVSGGTFFPGRRIPSRKEITFDRDQAYFRKASRALKKMGQVPVILVGGIRSFLLAERLVDEDVMDYIAMCRPFIREPMLIKRWQSGDLRKATCISCNGCFGPARSGRGILCVQDIQWKS